MPQNNLPNAYIVGVQKAGTTTLYDWLIQHPEIYGLNETKDVDFFADPEVAKNARELLQKAFKNHKDEPVILQCFVNYLLYENALDEICQLSPTAHIIVILRNPIERAFSAYHHFKKFNKETRNIGEALLYKPNDNITFSTGSNNFTYIEHGFYYKQLKKLFEIFPAEQILILEFDDLKKQPENLLKNVYRFLEISEDYLPNMVAKNTTGEIKKQWLQNMLTKSNSFRQNLIKYTIGLFISPEKRRLIRYKLIEMNTRKKYRDKTFVSETDNNIRLELSKLFLPDVKKLDELLGTHFTTKWFGEYKKSNS